MSDVPGRYRPLSETFAAGLEDSMRGPHTFGPPVDVPPDADEQARMLAFLGRDPRPTGSEPA